ncbi:MAG TPA: HD domain-containing phosphohydrolase [bacterium]|jgi:putative nucleotidyltransferase with HDIG domain
MPDDTSIERRRAKKRGILLASGGLGLALSVLIALKLLGLATVRMEQWALAVAVTAVVQGVLWLIPHRGWDRFLPWDRHYLYTPMLAASLLMMLYISVAPGGRILLLMAWFTALMFMVGRVGFAGVVALSSVMGAGYLTVTSLLLARVDLIAPTRSTLLFEGTVAAVFMVINVYAGIVFERLRRERDERRALQEEQKRSKDRIERQLHRLAALRMIDIAITSSHELYHTLEIILAETRAQLRADAVAVLTLDSADGRHLIYAAGRGFHTPLIRRTRLLLGEGLPGRAAVEGRLVHSIGAATLAADTSRPNLVMEEEFESYYALPLIAKGKVRGVLEVFHRTPAEHDGDWMDFLHTIAGQTAIAIDSSRLFGDLQNTNEDLRQAYDLTIEGWSRALELRDRETQGHTARVAELTLRLAQTVGVTGADLEHLRRGALLHDIGKMGIPDSILLKSGPLTAEEWDIMRQHPTHAYELLNPIAFLRPALDIPYSHHEKWNGTGYPRGLHGEAIPVAARIFAAVDVWDALRSVRPYRPPWTAECARSYITSESGSQFDPQVVQAFLSLDLS